jgi:glycosyltransferase involved in cell wall biosynthesis
MDPADTESIANGIIQILSDPKLRETLSYKGLERSSVFTWDSCARTTLELLERVAFN